MTIQLDTVVAAIESYTGIPARKSGKGYRLPCPAHQGKDTNLYLADSDNKLLIKCHSHQCDPKDILESVGLSLTDIYYQRLTGSALNKHQAKVNDRYIKKELEHEIIILLCWLADFWEGVWPRNEKADPQLVALAIKRVNAATGYFMREGIK